MPWTNISSTTIGGAAHLRVQQEAAAQGIVLLKNEGGVVPLKQQKGLRIAVVGPQAVAQAGLLSDYFGDQVCFGGNYECIVTIGAAITSVNQGGTTTVSAGVDINSNRTSGIAAALQAVKGADVTVLVLGIDRSIEAEGTDRSNTTLPGLQESFAMQVFDAASGRPVILILVNGGILSIDRLISSPQAIIEAFNIAFGAPALARAIFGQETNAWGKLPVTIYPSSYATSQIDPRTMDMTQAPGRTYR